MGIVVSCMPDDGQYREQSLLTQSPRSGTSRGSSVVPVFSAQAMAINSHNTAPRRQVYLVSELDFRQHAKIHVNLPPAGNQSRSRCELILVDVRGRHYQLPGLGRGRASSYEFTWVQDGMLAIELISGPGEHYTELHIRVIDTDRPPIKRPTGEAHVGKTMAE